MAPTYDHHHLDHGIKRRQRRYGQTGIICRVPPPGGHGTFVSDVLGQSYVVMSKNKFIPLYDMSFILGYADKNQEARRRRETVQNISRRFIRVLTQAVRYLHNPISAALSSAYACNELARSTNVPKVQQRELAAQAKKFSEMAVSLVAHIKPASMSGVLLPTNVQALEAVPLQRQDETAIELALKLRDREFTKHPTCEEHVDTLWHGANKVLDTIEWPSVPRDMMDRVDSMQWAKLVGKNICKLNDIDVILSPITRFFTAFAFLIVLVALQHCCVWRCLSIYR